MEKLSNLQLLHYQVKNDIFNLLTKYNIISHVSSTLHSKIPVYSFSNTFNIRKITSENSSFTESLLRLLEIKFLLRVSGEDQEKFYFIKNEDYGKLNDIEKNYYSIISSTFSYRYNLNLKQKAA